MLLQSNGYSFPECFNLQKLHHQHNDNDSGQPMNFLFTLNFNWLRKICTPLGDKIIMTVDIQRTICYALYLHLQFGRTSEKSEKEHCID